MQGIATDPLFRTLPLVGALLIFATTGIGQPVDVDKLRAKKEATAFTAPNANSPSAFRVTAGSNLVRVDPKPRNGFMRVVRPDKGPQAWIPQDAVELAHKAEKSSDEHQCAQSLADCPPRGCEPEGAPDAIANALKRTLPREGTPVPLTFADIASLQRQADHHVGQGPPELSQEKRISLRDLNVAAGRVAEHDRVRMIGYIAKGGEGLHANTTGESVNCMLKKPEENDFHIPLVNDAKDLELQGIVVEMIPQRRSAAWTLDALKTVQANGQQVWVEGALFYDKVHYVEDDPDAPLKDEPERASLWEIHPVTKFLVCRKDHCNPQAEKEWTPLGVAVKHIRRFLLLIMLCCSGVSYAQGGPPMATDDPGTPGDGHWEINLAAVGTHTGNTWNVDTPDADINYGVGERIQLNLDFPYAYTNASGGWKSAVGDTSIGVKWRFLDNEETDGLQLSTYPRFQTSLSSRAERIGLASPDKEFFLPVEAAMKLQSFDVAADLGRHFVEHEDSFWSAGIVVGHSCGTEKVQCLVELHREWKPQDPQTLLNLGLRWKLNDSMTILAAAGREFGAHNEDQARALLYLGVQVLR